MEEITINLNDDATDHVHFSNQVDVAPQSVFGGGAEMLMNDRRRTDRESRSGLGDLDLLERELNDLSSSPITSSSPLSRGESKPLSGFSGFFSSGTDAGPSSGGNGRGFGSDLGASTADLAMDAPMSQPNSFSYFDQMPQQEQPYVPAATDHQVRRKKRAMLKKLAEWREKGLLKGESSSMNMDTPFEDVEDEYESALDDKRRKDSVKLQGWWFMTFINSVEYGNAAFNPFDFNLDGWGEQVSEDLESYEDIFSELHDKYKGGKLAPEVSLLLRIGFSAAVVNITNKALSTATPGFNDVIRQSPELMKMFTNATVQSMAQQDDRAGFINQVMNPGSGGGSGSGGGIANTFGPPPAPMRTKLEPRSAPIAVSRPDLNSARGMQMPYTGDQTGIDMQSGAEIEEVAPRRAEMQGPAALDLDSILAGLKPRGGGGGEGSIDQDMPKRAGRRRKTDRHIVAMDI